MIIRGLPPAQGLCHGFTGRTGGVSEGALCSLNLALSKNESVEAYTENWRRAVRALHPVATPAQVVLLNQVHKGDVVVIDAPMGVHQVTIAADAMITAQKNIVLGIRTADCVPVLFSAPGAVGAAHAGWRGVAASVLPNTIEALCTQVGCAPSEISAVIGPHISGAVYRVGDEVVAGIESTGIPAHSFSRRADEALFVDLRAACTLQLHNCGVQQVFPVSGCTFSDDRFFSYRRDGHQTGRQAALIGRLE